MSPECPDHIFSDLAQEAERFGGDGIIVERNRPDLPQLMTNADLIICQGGANTLIEAAQAKSRFGVATLIVPHLSRPAELERNEQYVRAKLMESMELVRTLLPTEASNPELFCASVESAITQPQPSICPIRLDGATQASHILIETMRQRV